MPQPIVSRLSRKWSSAANSKKVDGEHLSAAGSEIDNRHSTLDFAREHLQKDSDSVLSEHLSTFLDKEGILYDNGRKQDLLEEILDPSEAIDFESQLSHSPSHQGEQKIDPNTRAVAKYVMHLSKLERFFLDKMPWLEPIQQAYLQIGDPTPVVDAWRREAAKRSKMFSIRDTLAWLLRWLPSCVRPAFTSELYRFTRQRRRLKPKRTVKMCLTASVMALMVTPVMNLAGLLPKPTWHHEDTSWIEASRDDLNVEEIGGPSETQFGIAAHFSDFSEKVLKGNALVTSLGDLEATDIAGDSTSIRLDYVKQFSALRDARDSSPRVVAALSQPRTGLHLTSSLLTQKDILEPRIAAIEVNQEVPSTVVDRAISAPLLTEKTASNTFTLDSFDDRDVPSTATVTSHPTKMVGSSDLPAWFFARVGNLRVWVNGIDALPVVGDRFVPTTQAHAGIEESQGKHLKETDTVTAHYSNQVTDTNPGLHPIHVIKQNHVVGQASHPISMRSSFGSNGVPVYEFDGSMNIDHGLLQLSLLRRSARGERGADVRISDTGPATHPVRMWLSRQLMTQSQNGPDAFR